MVLTHGFIVNGSCTDLDIEILKKLHDNSRNTLFIDILMDG